MRRTLASRFVATLAVAGIAHAAPPADSVPLPTRLRGEILAADGRLFDAVFDSCEATKLEPLVTADFEFYHDQNGVVANSGEQFVRSIREMCAHRGEWRSRRELVEDSVEVYPIKGYGAMEVGVHRFHERESGQPERLAGTAKFSHVWKLEDGRWKLSRVLSYGHEAAK